MEMTPRELRAYVLERDGKCVWPGCVYEQSGVNPLECAHLIHRQMGGGPTRNVPDNAVTLCKIHHDVFDGRKGPWGSRWELAMMLRAVCKLKPL